MNQLIVLTSSSDRKQHDDLMTNRLADFVTFLMDKLLFNCCISGHHVKSKVSAINVKIFLFHKRFQRFFDVNFESFRNDSIFIVNVQFIDFHVLPIFIAIHWRREHVFETIV